MNYMLAFRGIVISTNVHAFGTFNDIFLERKTDLVETMCIFLFVSKK